MWERLSDAAIAAVSLASEEADHLGQNYLGDEHLIVGLLRAGDPIAAAILIDAGLSIRLARDTLIRMQDRRLTPAARPDPSLALRALGIDLAQAQRNLGAVFGSEAVATATCQLTRRPWWRGGGRRHTALSGQAVFIKQTLEDAGRHATVHDAIEPSDLLAGVLNSAARPVGTGLSRSGRRQYSDLGGRLRTAPPALLLLRGAGIDPDELLKQLVARR